MSKEISRVQKAEIVSELTHKIQLALTEANKRYLFVGWALDKIDKEKLWTAYADHFEKLEDFFQELHIPRSTGYHYINIYRKFGEYIKSNQIDTPPVRRLIKALPVATQDNQESWITDAIHLTEQDFNKKVNLAKGRPEQTECRHPEDKRVYFYRCLICKQWVKLESKNLRQVLKYGPVKRKKDKENPRVETMA